MHRCNSNLGIGSAQETEVTNNVELHPEDDGKVVHVSTMTEKKTFANASAGSELKEWPNRCTQIDKKALPQTLKRVRKENRVFKQCVKRQSIKILNIKDVTEKTLNASASGYNWLVDWKCRS